MTPFNSAQVNAAHCEPDARTRQTSHQTPLNIEGDRQVCGKAVPSCVTGRWGCWLRLRGKQTCAQWSRTRVPTNPALTNNCSDVLHIRKHKPLYMTTRRDNVYLMKPTYLRNSLTPEPL